jgi:hypothetical protein
MPNKGNEAATMAKTATDFLVSIENGWPLKQLLVMVVTNDYGPLLL